MRELDDNIQVQDSDIAVDVVEKKTRAKRFPRSESERVKPERIRGVFNGTQTRMQVSPIEGYQIRWMNDIGNNLRIAQSGGWEFVGKDEVEFSDAGTVMHRNEELGGGVAITAGANADGKGMTAYLMKIPQEFYDEDRSDYLKRCEDVMRPIKDGEGAAANFEGAHHHRGEKVSSYSVGR